MKLLVAHTLALGGSPITAIDLVAGPRRHGHDDSRQSSDDLPVQVFDELGYNYKLTDILAAIALVQLDREPALLTARRRIGERYRDSLDGVVGLTLPGTADDRDHAWQTYALTLAPECSRDAVARELHSN
jgi:dTDP-4-amino-4,6-dideoxygalactose transaminase